MLNNFQKEIVEILSENRREYSYFSGGSILNLDFPRKSADFDIFQDDIVECEKSFVTDIGILRSNGYSVEIEMEPSKNGIGKVSVCREGESTRIEWAVDSAFRFFPVEKDPALGFKLNYHDLAINKILAQAGRIEVRDYYDVCEMIRAGKPIVAYVWAACGKDPGYSPALLLDTMARNSKFQKEDFLFIDADDDKKMTITECKSLFVEMLNAARDAYQFAPIEEQGCLYFDVDTKEVFFPSEEDFIKGRYVKHEGRMFGSYPEFKTDDNKQHFSPGLRTRMR